MIKIDPLYLLLLIELVCLLTGGLVFLLLRYKKYRALYQAVVKDLVTAQHREQELQKQLVHARESPAAPAAVSAGPTATLSLQNAQEIDDLRTRLQEAEDALGEKKRKLEQLEAKFADLEKEYMVLYQQQQSQQNQPDI